MWRHVVGSDPSEDACVYHEIDDSFYIGLGRSRSERLLYIHAGAVRVGGQGNVGMGVGMLQHSQQHSLDAAAVSMVIHELAMLAFNFSIPSLKAPR